MNLERLLEKRAINYKPVGSYYQVRCLSPDHEDKNPSMFINKFTGWANCKSCGISYNIFKLFDEKPNWLQIAKDKFRELLIKKASEGTYLEFPESTVFWKDSYRGISKETIQKFQGFQCSEFPGYLCFPIKNYSDKIVNFIGRDTTGTRTPKYLFLHKKPILMYPVNNAKNGSVILVEGIFDFLNLYDKGLTNTRTLFGADTFRPETADLLKIEGVDEVIIMLDPDKAGQLGTEKIKKILDEKYLSYKVINLPENCDPAELNQQTINNIKEQLYGKSSSYRE